MTYLLDSNVLLALAWQRHEHHQRASIWFDAVGSFATCPFTQAGFLRISSNPGIGYAIRIIDAFGSLDSIMSDQRHTFWPDDLDFGAKSFDRTDVHSHGQVTDQYLLALARMNAGLLATFDGQLSKCRGAVAVD